MNDELDFYIEWLDEIAILENIFELSYMVEVMGGV